MARADPPPLPWLADEAYLSPAPLYPKMLSWLRVRPCRRVLLQRKTRQTLFRRLPELACPSRIRLSCAARALKVPGKQQHYAKETCGRKYCKKHDIVHNGFRS